MGAFVVTYPVVDGAVIRSVAALGGVTYRLGPGVDGDRRPAVNLR